MNKDEQRNTTATSTVSTKEAAAIAGMTPRSLQNYITSGKLSATRDDGGNYQIQLCELYRVFPEKPKEKKPEKEVKRNSRETLEQENKHLKETIDFLNKQNEFMEKRLESSEAKEALLIETLNSNLKLLEHKENKKKRRRFFGLF